MSGLSCFGNFSLGELAQIQSLSFNLPTSMAEFDALLVKEKCSIPGFNPPNLPTISLPPIPIFSGIPPFPLFCLLPPFPGLPALSLPAISIPIPPIPFIPPIPLPIPGFALPVLPTLPSFDLGSLSFLCGLLNIDLPVLDPFASLNDLINQLNSLIVAFGNFLDFCKENAETINATEAPPTLPPSVATPFTAEEPTSPAPSGGAPLSLTGGRNQGGFNVPTPVQGELRQQTQDQQRQTPAQVDFSAIVVDPNQPAGDLALLLADAGQIPAEGSLINKVANLLAPLGNMSDVTQEQVQNLLEENDVPSPDGFVGFKSTDLVSLLPNTVAGLTDDLTNAGLLADNRNVRSAALEVLKSLDLAELSPVEVATALNSQGIPFGTPPITLARITQDDVSRAHFLRPSSAPLTGRKIVNTLVLTGIVDKVDTNITNAIAALEELPSPLTPATLEVALENIIPGAARGSLKAACLAATKGINEATQVEINEARSQALLSSAAGFSKTTFVQKLLSLTSADFRRFFRNTTLPLPVSLFDLVPLLAIEFEIDDFALVELFSMFNTSGTFSDLDSLFSALQFIAQSVSSQQAAVVAIRNCDSVREGDFSFSNVVSIINLVMQKFGITFPTDADGNKQIANALKTDQGFSYLKVLEVLGENAVVNVEELTFLLLATGLIQEALFSQSGDSFSGNDDSLSSLGNTGLAHPIIITIKSPTNIVDDIVTSSLNISLKTKKASSAGIVSLEHIIIEDGVTSSGSTIVLTTDDLNGKLEIKILRVGGFVEVLEAIEEIVASANFISTFNTTEQSIPGHLITTRS